MPISPDYGDLFSDWELAIAHKLIREFRSRWSALRKYETDDLLQEVFLHWYRNRSEYDPAKEASIKTYCATVIRNKLLDLVRAASSDKRKVSHYTVDESGEDVVSLIDKHAVSDPEQTTAGLDISKALQKLTPRQQELCQLLKQGVSRSGAAKQLGISRRNVYYELKKIRLVFIKEGIKPNF